jgi:WD40 repeat protein
MGSGVTSVALLHSGRILYAVSGDGTVTAFDVWHSRLLFTRKAAVRWPLPNPTVFSYGSWIATMLADGAVRISRLSSGALRCDVAGFGRNVESAAVSPSGNEIAVMDTNAIVRLVDARDGRVIATTPGALVPSNPALFSRDGGRFICYSVNSLDLLLWTRRHPGKFVRAGRFEWSNCIALSPDGERTAACDSGGGIRVSEIGADESVKQDVYRMNRPYPPGGDVSFLAFTPDSRSLLVGLSNGTICMWRFETGRREYLGVNA